MAFMWLVGSWVVAIGLRQPLSPSASSYEPSVRMMLFSMCLGLMIGWPLMRLSQARSPWPYRQTLLDLMVLMAMVQVILWPLRLVTTWSRERTFVMDLSVIGWAMIAGAVVAAGVGAARSGPRVLAMLMCVSLCLAGPALAWIALRLGIAAPNDLIGLSPLLAVQTLAMEGSLPVSTETWSLVAVLLIAGCAGWTILGFAHMVRARSRSSLPN